MRHELLLQNTVPTPLGTLRLAAVQLQGRGVVPTDPLRVYGRYAVVCLLRGRGVYRDVNGLRRDVGAGDVIVVFPELAHAYGPRNGETWDELYLTFDGPVFDLWRQTGLLSTSRPVQAGGKEFAADLREIIESRDKSAGGRLAQMNRFLHLLGLLTGAGDEQAAPDGERWADHARAVLELNLEMPLDLKDAASELGMGYENFRKRFCREVGVSPAQYRAGRRIEAAKELLRYAPHLTNRQIATSLGYGDEYHFSRRFSRATGYTPRAFRRREIEAREARVTEREPATVRVRELIYANETDQASLLELRAKVLRPGQPVANARFAGDDLPTTHHFGAFNEAGELVGVTTILEKDGWQLRGMAVAPQAQRTGVGAALLTQVHARADREGWQPLWCNARASAVDFYARSGWTVTSDVFDVPGIGPHYVMRRR